MKSGRVEDDSFDILNDDHQMVGHASVFERKLVVVNGTDSYRDLDPLHTDLELLQQFADAEARRLGMIDEQR